MDKIKIIVEKDKEKVSYELHSDNDMKDWMYVFASILSFITFPPDTISEYLFKEDEEEMSI